MIGALLCPAVMLLITALTVEVHRIAGRPADGLILASAESAEADCLVTGDSHLVALVSFRNLTIRTPRAFLEMLQEAKA